MDLAAIQQALRERNIDAWLFYDHHHRDPISYRVLGLPDGLMVTRRWYYLIPAQGEPQKLVHKIESGHLDTLPGTKKQYAGWEELFYNIKQMLAPHRDIAMQYSPNNFVFTISMVDAGTADMIRGLGKNIVSAADLIAQVRSHAQRRTDQVALCRPRCNRSGHGRGIQRNWPPGSRTAEPTNMRSSNFLWKRSSAKTW